MIMAWELKHSVVANADLHTAWKFHSNIDNMARIEGGSVESITLDGPFRAGARGTTKRAGQEPLHWRLAEVEPPVRSVTELELAGAVLRFTWTFDELPDGRTRLSQHIALEGPGAGAYESAMEALFAENVKQGMQRVAEEMEKSAMAGAGGQDTIAPGTSV
jgi:hypothetical protein